MLALGLAIEEHGVRGPDAEEVYAHLHEPKHRDARHLYSDWLAKHSSGGFIVGVHVPSRALAKLLPGLALCEPVNDGHDYRVRLAGSHMLRRFGREVTGKKLSDLFADRHLVFHRGLMRRVHVSGEPFMLDVHVMRDGLSRLHFELLGVQVFSPDCRWPWIMMGQFLYHD